MRKYWLGLGAVTALFVSSQSAMADGPWYVSGSIGAYIRQDASIDSEAWLSSGAIVSGTDKRTYNAGPVINVAVGRRIFGPFRIEGELGYANYDAGSASPKSSVGRSPDGSRLDATSGDYDRYTATVNAFYDFPMFGRLMPYVGGGVGFAHTVSSPIVYSGATGTFREPSSDDNSAIILGEIGGAVALDNTWSIVPSYRFVHYFNDGNTAEENAHILKVGLRYSF